MPAENSAPMTEAERQRLLVEWNNTRAEYPSDKCVHELFSEQAGRTPHGIAVVQGNRQLTFRELNQRANQLADCLRRKGVRSDIPVAICLPRSLELVVALLGVMKAGAACLPLDPDYPAERLAYMLEDSQAPLLLTQPGLLLAMGNSQPEVLHLHSDWKVLDGYRSENTASPATPKNLAYIIYTSGSTGKPRGVLLSHRGLVNHHFAAVRLYDLAPSDRTLQFSSISFDIAVEEIFPTWIAGGTVVLRTEEMPLSGEDFLRWIGQHGITVLDLPTAYWHELVRALTEAGAALPKTLRLLIVGGEKASASAYGAWLKCGGSRVRWINTYGPTEASIIVSSYEPDASDPIPDNLPIGRPIANIRLYILDEKLQPVPAGTPGELHVGGPGVARGYLRRPELTAQKFIADPYSSDPGATLYKTGDLVRYLPDRNIEFLGRTDFQVKIRGFRVELGEIEAVLEKHEGVAEGVVVAREVDGEKRLASYVVASRPRPQENELRKFLRERLPEYMVPADFVFLESFPLTPNGKVDRRALPVPQVRELEAGADFVAPRNEVERRMASLWEQVLGKRPIGVRENFFELGGHSLAAVRLMQRVEKEFGRKFLLTALLQAPTVEQFAATLQQDSAAVQSSVIPMQPLGSKPPFFFVHGMGGTVMRFRDLTRYMAPDQPFYGLQAQGLDGSQPVLQRVEDMAKIYLKDLRATQPEGPYYLGGYSFGGYVALEMARLLVAEGQEVRVLAFLDTYAEITQSIVERFLSLSIRQKLIYLKKRARRYRLSLKHRIQFLFLPPAVKDVRRSCALAEANYRVHSYEGKILLFRAAERGLRSLEDASAGWEKYALGGVEVHQLDGDHGNILNEPGVQAFAAKLRACLEAAQAQPEFAAPNLSGSDSQIR
jgi:amino acid adenylation domain-containing protein